VKEEIRRISYADILDAEGLLREYSAECSIPEIGIPDPQRDIYARMESSGLMHSFGVFDGIKLVGFATLLVFVLPHYGKTIANVESLFIARLNRSGGGGKRFMEYIESFAASRGCTGVLYNARAGSALERLMSSLSRYKRTNSVFLWKAA